MKSLAPEADADLEYEGDQIRFQDLVCECISQAFLTLVGKINA